MHPTLGLHSKALVAEGPQGWTLSRTQELPHVRSEPLPDRAESASNAGQASGRVVVRKGKKLLCSSRQGKEVRHERCRPAGTKVSAEGRQEVLQACSSSFLQPKRSPQKSRPLLSSPQALRRADLCPWRTPARAAPGWSPNLGHLEKQTQP